MPASKHVTSSLRLASHSLRLASQFALVLALVGSSFAQETSPVTKLAADIFGKLEVRLVRCPAYTYDGGNQPVCGVSDLTPEAFTEAFDAAAKGKLEPQSPWDEDHTVWLRRYSAGGVAYAAIYSEIARDFNVQLVQLK